MARGKVSGLRARGGFTVDIEWKDGKVVKYRLTCANPCPLKVRVNGEVKVVVPEKTVDAQRHRCQLESRL